MSIAPGQIDDTHGLAVDSVADDSSSVDGAVAVRGRSPWEIFRSRLRRDRVSMVALVFSVLFLVIAAVSPLLTRLGVLKPDDQHPDLVTGIGSMPTGLAGGITGEHPLGVEPGTGRDLLSRIVTGMTTSLTVAVLATVMAIVLGTVLGLVAGFAGGSLDWGVSRFLDLVLSFPTTLMLLSLGPVLRQRIAGFTGLADADPKVAIIFMVLVLGFFGIPFFARIIRGQVLSLREREFVEAARSLGAGRTRIYLKELLPHLWAPILVYTTLVMPQNIAAEAALGFLGVGINPPTASLGAILNDSIAYALPDPAYFFFPGLTVFVLVLAFNLLGDGLRDALDPRAGRA